MQLQGKVESLESKVRQYEEQMSTLSGTIAKLSDAAARPRGDTVAATEIKRLENEIRQLREDEMKDDDKDVHHTRGIKELKERLGKLISEEEAEDATSANLRHAYQLGGVSVGLVIMIYVWFSQRRAVIPIPRTPRATPRPYRTRADHPPDHLPDSSLYDTTLDEEVDVDADGQDLGDHDPAFDTTPYRRIPGADRLRSLRDGGAGSDRRRRSSSIQPTPRSHSDEPQDSSTGLRHRGEFRSSRRRSHRGGSGLGASGFGDEHQRAQRSGSHGAQLYSATSSPGNSERGSAPASPQTQRRATAQPWTEEHGYTDGRNGRDRSSREGSRSKGSTRNRRDTLGSFTRRPRSVSDTEGRSALDIEGMRVHPTQSDGAGGATASPRIMVHVGHDIAKEMSPATSASTSAVSQRFDA